MVSIVFSLLVLACAVSYRVGRRQGGEWVAARMRDQESARVLSLEEVVGMNVIDGVVLPEPEDPRWELVVGPLPEHLQCGATYGSKHHLVYRLGDIRVWIHNGFAAIAIDRGPGAWSFLTYPGSHVGGRAQHRLGYFYAIDKAWIGRRALESIEKDVDVPALRE